MKKNLIFFLPNFAQGGAGKSIYNICKMLNKHKYTVYVLSLGKNAYKKELISLGIKILELKTESTFFSLKKINKFLKTFDKTKTVVISNINYANALFVLYFKMLNNYKLILIERTPYQELNFYFNLKDFLKKQIVKFIINFFYKKADIIICNSKKTSNDFSKITGKKCNFVYPLTINKINKFDRKKINSKKIKLISIGRLSWEKNFSDQIDALELLNNKNICLYILGDGNLKENFKSHIKKRRINCKVLSYSDKNKIKLLRQSHIYICSSFFEGFPNAVVEAINFNLPVITSRNHGGIEEIILNGKGGYFYEVNNKYDLIKKINYLIKNYHLGTKKSYLAKKNLLKFTKQNIKKYENFFDVI